MLLYFINFFIGYLLLILKNKRKIILLYMFFLFIGNSYNVDYENYVRFFKNISNDLMKKEILYTLTIKIFNFFNLEYKEMLIFYGIIAFYLIVKTVNKFSKNSNLVYLLYFIYPFIYDTIQIRNFMVMAILTYSIKYIVKKNFFKYCIAIFIASGFHKVAYIYLICYFVNFFNEKKIFWIAIISNIIGIIAYFTNFFPMILKGVMNEVDIKFYFIDNNSRFGWILYIFVQLVFLLFFIKNLKNKEVSFNYIVLKINYLFICFIPLYFFNSTLDRIYRNILIMNYVVISNIIKNNLKYINIFILFAEFLYFIFCYRYFKNELLFDLLNYNWIFDLIKNRI